MPSCAAAWLGIKPKMIKKLLHKESILPVVFIAVAIFGIFITRQYGESWDVLKFYKYADSALASYATWPLTGNIPIIGNTYDNYGPAYVMFVSLGARALGAFIPWINSDLRHLIYWFTYLVGIWAFYELAKRWLSQTGAIGATLLFATQPLFWGHAFISPKDIPFLTFFLLSLVFGFKMVDSLEPLSTDSLTLRTIQNLVLLTSLWLLFIFIFFGGTQIFYAMLENAVRAAAAGQPNLISRIASDIHKVRPEVYIQKYFTLFIQVRAILFWLSTAILGWVYFRVLPTAFRFLAKLTPAAIFLGLTICIRVLGPLAGLIIIIYAVYKKGKSSVPALLTYVFIAVIAMYATWPYLWPDPIGHFVESVIVMAKYPWQGQVLFDGKQYASTAIPRSYLPVLLGIQLTEPVWILFAAGLAVTIFGAVKKRANDLQTLALTLVWFLFPLAGFITLRSPLYDNFRQIFFILPPIFLMAGAAFEKIKRPALQISLIVLVLLPGVVDGIRLHPYEYIYYNRFIGGVPGAFRRFELDYWGTSYREAADWLNTRAPDHATVWIEGPAHLFQLYVRRDLKTYSTDESERADHYDYIVATSRYNLDQTSYPDAEVIHAITREGAILTVIKQTDCHCSSTSQLSTQDNYEQDSR
ncbi:MAG TPA: hypothetical protein VMT73_02870 [Anaerolineales bacterium]|nr:hypothetical protein [Anaerolineales bacterium]